MMELARAKFEQSVGFINLSLTGCVGSVRGSNPYLVCCVHFHKNVHGKGINLIYGLNSKVDKALKRLG